MCGSSGVAGSGVEWMDGHCLCQEWEGRKEGASTGTSAASCCAAAAVTWSRGFAGIQAAGMQAAVILPGLTAAWSGSYRWFYYLLLSGYDTARSMILAVC